MSYILDALRKADAERERDPARGIHAQPAALPTEASRRVAPFAAGAAALVVVGAGAAWMLRPGAAPAVAAAPAAAPVAAAVPVAPVAPPVPSPATQAPAPAVIPVATAVSPPAPPPLPAPAPERVAPKAAPAVVAKAAPAAAAVAAPAAAPASAAVAAPLAASVAARAPAPAPAADRVLAYAELPPEVQRELPKLQISGGVHSQNAAQRMLIVGGQVMNEGAEIAPGVFIEQIRPRTAVLKFRGYRYSVGY